MVKISIVMTCYNRREQVLFTLKTISNTAHKDLEIIIVDDCSNESNKITLDILHASQIGEILKLLDIKVIRLDTRSWINPCIAYNIGIKASTGDIIILQNGEVCHIGDCVSFVSKNLEESDWLTLNCYGLGSFQENTNLHDLYTGTVGTGTVGTGTVGTGTVGTGTVGTGTNWTNTVYEFVRSMLKKKRVKIGGNSIATNNVSGWLNNVDMFFTAYHYFGAIWRKSLFDKMDGGFCEEYKDGLCYDDIDFVKYLIHNEFKFKINKFDASQVFVIHQYHEKSQCMIDNPEGLSNINRTVFDKRMEKINANTYVNIRVEFKMPTPIIIS